MGIPLRYNCTSLSTRIAPVWIKAAKSGGLPTTEVPRQPSHIVAAAKLFATAQEKRAVREYEDSQRKLATSGRSR